MKHHFSLPRSFRGHCMQAQITFEETISHEDAQTIYERIRF